MLIKLSFLVLLCICLTSSMEIKCKILNPITDFDEHTRAYCYNVLEEDLDDFSEQHMVIHELKLARTNINYVDEFLFMGFTNLTNLTIIDSAIEEIEQNSLVQLENLQVLEISLSELQRLDDFTFGNLTNLNQLILNDNFISEIDPYTFSNLTNLRELELKNNELEVIYADTFIGLTNVEVIDLSGNPIKNIEESSFDSCISLRKLILEKSSHVYLSDLHFSHDFEVVFVTSEQTSQQRLQMVISQEYEELMNSKPNSLNHPLIALSMIITLIGIIIFLLVATVLLSCFLKKHRYINANCSKLTGPVAGGLFLDIYFFLNEYLNVFFFLDYSKLPSIHTV